MSKTLKKRLSELEVNYGEIGVYDQKNRQQGVINIMIDYITELEIRVKKLEQTRLK